MLNDLEFEKVLREALAERLTDTSDFQGRPTLKFCWRFKRMLADPFGYAKRWQETPGQKLRRWAVAAALLLAIAGSSFLFVPQMRVMAVNMLVRIYEGFNSYSFYYKAAPEEEMFLPEIEIGYIPEGYNLYAEYNTYNKHIVFDYKNTEGDILSIFVDVNENGFAYYYDNEHNEQRYILLNNGQQAVLLKGDFYEWGNSLIWTSEKGDITFSIDSRLSEKELLNIANNISLK